MKVKDAQGISFGVMDAVVTVLGVMIGLSIINDKNIVFTGSFIAGFSDSFANSAGMYALRTTGKGGVSLSSYYCFASTLAVTLLLTIPLWILPLDTSLFISVTIGMIALVGIGYIASSYSKLNPYKLMAQYVVIGVSVSFISFLIGVVII